MVSHLVRFLEERYALSATAAAATEAATAEEGGGEEVTAMALESPHLVSCYESFCSLGGSTEALLNKLREEECETWMSGLICALTPVCAREYMLLVPEGKVSTATLSGMSTSTAGGKEGDAACPPGCGCDNPWQFVQDAMMKKGDS